MISTSFIVVQRGRGTVSNNLRFHENPWMEVNNSCTKRNRGTWWKNSCSVVGCISTEGVGGGGEEEENKKKKKKNKKKKKKKKAIMLIIVVFTCTPVRDSQRVSKNKTGNVRIK